MKSPFVLLCLGIVAVLPCCHNSRKVSSAPETTVFPSFTSYPQQRPVPKAVIADLPRRLRDLPGGRGIPLEKLVRDLGLGKYRANVSNNMRWNHHFLYLDENHALYMEIDLNTLPQYAPPFRAPWKSKVISCQLRENPDRTLATRVLVPAS